MNTEKKGLFVTADGRNVAFTFALVSSLFLLWGFCNGMIDVMDKHFQNELKLTLSQSAWVQFAHYLGYFIMALPAGWLAIRLGYKGGIIAGLLMVAVGGLWFIPATHIAKFWAFLLGVCTIAAGLTFLETVANPYTTVLGDKRFAATRINLAQSCNGVGWILGPIAGGLFFYGTDETGRSTGAETLWIPYAGVAVVVILLAVIFFFAPMPDINTEDDYHLDDKNNDKTTAIKPASRGLTYGLLLVNIAILLLVFGMITWLILSATKVGESLKGLAAALPHPSSFTINADHALTVVLFWAGVAIMIVAAIVMAPMTKKISHHSIWSHPHFSGAVAAQFLYVAAQAGIFSFLINYVTSEVPDLPASWHRDSTKKWIEINTSFTRDDLKDLPALAARLKNPTDPVTAMVAGKLSSDTQAALAEYVPDKTNPKLLSVPLVQDLKSIVRGTNIYNPQLFAGVNLSPATREILALPEKERNTPLLNRLLLTDAFAGLLNYTPGRYCISDAGASNLASFGFFCFLVGRFTGAWLLKRFSAHRMLGLYGLMNVLVCLLVFFKLGWLSVVCVFLSYFFMSIMFPTIFALGIFGLGVRAKRASAYIVMAIMGGAILPKLMGYVADQTNMSRGFIVPMICFVAIALYGFGWSRLSQAESLSGLKTTAGH